MFKARNLLAAGLLLCLLVIPAHTITASPAQPITIITPGEGSVLSSPIHLAAEVQLESGDSVRISLTNGSNFPISRKLYRVSIEEESTSMLELTLPFEIPTETARAYLTVSIIDRYNRPKSLRTVELTLANDGTNTSVPQENTDPWLVLDEPEAEATFNGGAFTLRGTVIPLLETPIQFELITDTGGVIGYALLAVDSPGEPLDFNLDISYDFINKERDVRLVIRQMTENFSGDAILDSILLTLSP